MKNNIPFRGKGNTYPLIMEYLKSGMFQLDFCELHNIKLTRFQYWYKKYKKELPSNNGNSFVPLKFADAPVETKPPDEIKICYPNGVVIKLLDTTPDNIVKTLVSLI